MNNESILKKSQTDWQRLDRMDDGDIDLSDCPEVTTQMFARAVVRRSAGELSVSKKVWKKNIQVNFKDLFWSLGKAALGVVSGNQLVAGASLMDALKALGLQDKPEHIAGLLIGKSLERAMLTLVKERKDLLVKKLDDRALKTLCSEQLDLSLEEKALTLKSDFFERPNELPILEAIKTPFAQWLQGFGLQEAQARSIADRLPSYFPRALYDEWESKDYAPLLKALEAPNNPFTEASDRSWGWRRYRGWLQEQVGSKRMFEEDFSLKRVYVPLRAYYKRPSDNQKERDFESGLALDKKYDQVVVDLHQEIDAWLEKKDREDAIRIISGGPGSGKSSFAKMLAAKHAETGAIPVLFVPLHQFDPSDDLVDAIGKFVREDRFLPQNPLDWEKGESRLLIIFDGLDELAISGKIAAEVARDFVSEVQKKLDRFNGRETCLQVLISGRELAIQANTSNLRKTEQILHVLPYFIPEEEQKDYLDPEKLLQRDDRQRWWAKYGEASGRGYDAMPPDLDGENLVEITAQPLLNYLVALSFVRGKIQFSDESNLNSIYEDLLKAVYERGWASEQHPGLKGVEERDFVRILEEIGLASWHGDRRTTTVKEIETHCDRRLKRLLEQFQEGAKAGVTRLLTAFYFRQSGASTEGEKTFEFTHKSFGEYLTAKRIVRAVRHIHKQLDRRQQEPDDGWDERQALTSWATLCGPSTMDEYLFAFIVDEIRLQDISEVSKWQQDLCQLTGFMLHHGMPMERLDPRPAYREECRQAHNAEEALLAVLNACARVTETISQIKWPDPAAFGAWVARLQGPRTLFSKNVLALQCLSFLDLSECLLLVRDLYRANLKRANLKKAILFDTNLFWVNLFGANYFGAIIDIANLEKAILERANLEEKDIERANLEEADLEGANLEGAYLEGAYLVKAYLKRRASK